ncbi:CHAP domain-containing protein [Streptomyces triculaminicus]|uniref:CHAP domain-containing protein n=1 Tax=Streptomyces triculaminicus TaxID=2816232 RepID=UPI0037D8FA02
MAWSSGQRPSTPRQLVWTNKRDRAHGHVGVVVAVKGRNITTVEGNTGYHNDSIHRGHYAWTGDGPALPGKTFRGVASPS